MSRDGCQLYNFNSEQRIGIVSEIQEVGGPVLLDPIRGRGMSDRVIETGIERRQSQFVGWGGILRVVRGSRLQGSGQLRDVTGRQEPSESTKQFGSNFVGQVGPVRQIEHLLEQFLGRLSTSKQDKSATLGRSGPKIEGGLQHSG